MPTRADLREFCQGEAPVWIPDERRRAQSTPDAILACLRSAPGGGGNPHDALLADTAQTQLETHAYKPKKCANRETRRAGFKNKAHSNDNNHLAALRNRSQRWERGETYPSKRPL